MDEQERRIWDRAQQAIEAAISVQKDNQKKGYFSANAEDVQLYDGYAEPGYDGTRVATGNWNRNSYYDRETRQSVDTDNTMPRLSRILEKLGFECEWSDEWTTCDDCGKLIRTQADSYGWTRSYSQNDCDVVCLNCIDPGEHLQSLEGDYAKANTIGTIDPAKHGYKRLPEDYQTGMHYGQDSSPKLVAKALEKQEIERFLFNIDDVGQFDTSWSAWVHEDEWELLDQKQFAEENTDGPSIAGAMERGLREASRKTAELPDNGGIKYATVNGDGTADVRLVSHEEFIEGIK